MTLFFVGVPLRLSARNFVSLETAISAALFDKTSYWNCLSFQIYEMTNELCFEILGRSKYLYFVVRYRTVTSSKDTSNSSWFHNVIGQGYERVVKIVPDISQRVQDTLYGISFP